MFNFNENFLNKREIKKAFKHGHLDLCREQLQRYGTIIKDRSFEENGGHYAGFHRKLTIIHHGHEWKLWLWNGETKSLALSH